jgi:hypothetical protein
MNMQVFQALFIKKIVAFLTYMQSHFQAPNFITHFLIEQSIRHYPDHRQ